MRLITRRTAKWHSRNVVSSFTNLTPRGRDDKIANIKGLEMFQVQVIWEILVERRPEKCVNDHYEIAITE